MFIIIIQKSWLGPSMYMILAKLLLMYYSTTRYIAGNKEINICSTSTTYLNKQNWTLNCYDSYIQVLLHSHNSLDINKQ